MSYAYVQSIEIESGGDNLALSFGSTPSVNSLIIVAASSYDGAFGVSAVSDNQGNTYTRAFTVAAPNDGNARLAVYYAVATTSSGTFTVTINPDGADADITLAIHEYTGNETTSVLDQTTTATGASSSPSSGNVTTAIDGELYFGAISHGDSANSTITAGTNYTEREEFTDGSAAMPINTEDKIASLGTHAATWSLGASRNWMCGIATFKPLADVATITSKRLVVGHGR